MLRTMKIRINQLRTRGEKFMWIWDDYLAAPGGALDPGPITTLTEKGAVITTGTETETLPAFDIADPAELLTVQT